MGTKALLKIWAAVTMFAAPSAMADIGSVYLCSLKVTQASGGRVLVDLRDHEVRLPGVSTEGDGWNKASEAFEGLNRVLQEQLVFPVYFLVKAQHTRQGNITIPELNIGLHFYNKFQDNRKQLAHGASGDARAFARLNTRLDSGRLVEFFCRAKDYQDI